MVLPSISIPHHIVTATSAEAGVRLDRFLTQAFQTRSLGEISRARLKSLIEQGFVILDGKTLADPSYRVKPGEMFHLTLPEIRAAEIEPQAIPLTVVHEDSDLIVIAKPAGMVVHPAPGNPDQTLVNALIAHCGDSLKGIGGERRPGIVHRLDKDTSGLLVAAKTDAAHHHLSALFADHDIERAYLAVVWGVPSQKEGRIEGNIGRDPHNRKRMTLRTRGGKPAATRWKVLQRFGQAASLIECRLETGRTHQIRVHLTALGHPLIGDKTYGRATKTRLGQLSAEARTAAETFSRQALHAYILGFRHPSGNQVLRFEQPLPADMESLILALNAG